MCYEHLFTQARVTSLSEPLEVLFFLQASFEQLPLSIKPRPLSLPVPWLVSALNKRPSLENSWQANIFFEALNQCAFCKTEA